MRRILLSTLAGAAIIVLALGVVLQSVQGQDDTPFGSDEDVTFAQKLWDQIKDYQSWKIATDYIEGRSPHGDVIRSYYSIASMGGMTYHVIVKDNFRGEDISTEAVAESPGEYFASATVMVQREEGYDPDNDNWFWVKYNADGTIQQNPKGMALAGRVAKGTGQGCISCHANAKGNDYFFTNDR